MGVNGGAVIPAVKRIGIGKAIAILKHLSCIGGIVELIVLDFPIVNMIGRSCQIADAHDCNGNQRNKQSQKVNLFGHAYEEKQRNPPLGYRVQGK